MNGKKRRSATYSADRGLEVSKIFIISVRLIERAGKEQPSNLAGRTVEYARKIDQSHRRVLLTKIK